MTPLPVYGRASHILINRRTEHTRQISDGSVFATLLVHPTLHVHNKLIYEWLGHRPSNWLVSNLYQLEQPMTHRTLVGQNQPDYWNGHGWGLHHQRSNGRTGNSWGIHHRHGGGSHLLCEEQRDATLAECHSLQLNIWRNAALARRDRRQTNIYCCTISRNEHP